MTTTANHRPAPTFADLPGLMSLMTGDDKHDQAATSTLDVLWVLYDRVLRVTPQTAGDDARDRFVLSKGHGPMAYYAVLAAKGFLDPADLPGFGAFGSILGLHPDRVLVPGAEISSGSLGHGLPLAVGMASACGPGGWPVRGCSCWSGTPSSTRDPTTRRSRSPGPPGWTRCTWWWWTTPRPPTAGRAGWRPGSPWRAGRCVRVRTGSRRAGGRVHRAASRPAAHGGRGGRAQVARGERTWRPCVSGSPAVTTDLLDEDPRLAVVLADITADAFGRPGGATRTGSSIWGYGSSC